jgi:hypothetical protein
MKFVETRETHHFISIFIIFYTNCTRIDRSIAFFFQSALLKIINWKHINLIISETRRNCRLLFLLFFVIFLLLIIIFIFVIFLFLFVLFIFLFRILFVFILRVVSILWVEKHIHLRVWIIWHLLLLIIVNILLVIFFVFIVFVGITVVLVSLVITVLNVNVAILIVVII